MAKLKATSVAGDLTVTGKVTSTVAGATTSTIGTVKLNNATNSTSTTEAATAAAVKAAYDRAGHSHPYVPTATGGNIVIHADSDASSTAEYITVKAGHNELTVGSSAGGGTATKGNDKIKFNGNQVYHAGAKPSKSDVGLSNVNNWGASSDKAHNSTSTYATTNMVAQVRAEKANTSHGNHVPATQTANNAVYLRNDNTWQTITPDKIGASPNSHSHSTITANTVSDWNTAHASGFWQGESKPNAPEASGWFWGYRMQHGNGYGAQIAIKNGGGRMYFRSQDSSGAGSWYNVYHTGNKPSLSDIGAAASSHGHSNATTSAHGFMSNTDKGKLDGIASGANNYSHPTGAGNNHIPSGGASGQFLKWSSSGVATWAADNNTWRGIQNNLTSTATDQSLSAAQGKILNDNKAEKFGAMINRGYSQNLDTQKGIGIFAYGDGCVGKPSDYGSFLQWANTESANPGADQNWLTQLASASYGGLFYRQRNNTAPSYTGWRRIIEENDFNAVIGSDPAQRVFNLPNGFKLFSNWYNLGSGIVRTVSYPSGTFKNTTAMPQICLYVPDNNWQSFEISSRVAVTSFSNTSFSLCNHGDKTVWVNTWVIGH